MWGWWRGGGQRVPCGVPGGSCLSPAVHHPCQGVGPLFPGVFAEGTLAQLQTVSPPFTYHQHTGLLPGSLHPDLSCPCVPPSSPVPPTLVTWPASLQGGGHGCSRWVPSPGWWKLLFLPVSHPGARYRAAATQLLLLSAAARSCRLCRGAAHRVLGRGDALSFQEPPPPPAQYPPGSSLLDPGAGGWSPFPALPMVQPVPPRGGGSHQTPPRALTGAQRVVLAWDQAWDANRAARGALSVGQSQRRDVACVAYRSPASLLG